MYTLRIILQKLQQINISLGKQSIKCIENPLTYKTNGGNKATCMVLLLYSITTNEHNIYLYQIDQNYQANNLKVNQ